jgi:hypothetical protein
MTYDVFKIINLDDFNASGLVSKKVSGFFAERGLKEVLVTKGNMINFLYEGIFLSLNLNEKNPFEFEDHAIFIDPNNDLWLGIKSED